MLHCGQMVHCVCHASWPSVGVLLKCGGGITCGMQEGSVPLFCWMEVLALYM